jgi:glycosyltransferase involved in cell wall biosynthesis
MLLIRFPVENRRMSKVRQRDGQVKFLFIGHLRKEKGIINLIKAWSLLNPADVSVANLTIAGSDFLNMGSDAVNLPNCTTKFGYIDDEEFEALIEDTDYVVLPYEGGTNSGVLSTATSYEKPCITSNIPCFSQSQYFLEDLSFRNPDDLQPMIARVINTHADKYDNYVAFLRSKNIDYQKDFDEDINQMYKLAQK